MTTWTDLGYRTQRALAVVVDGGTPDAGIRAELRTLEAAGLVRRDRDVGTYRATDLGLAVYHQRPREAS
jgi:hypothetical protein